jgi:hypothetical protein
LSAAEIRKRSARLGWKCTRACLPKKQEVLAISLLFDSILPSKVDSFTTAIIESVIDLTQIKPSQYQNEANRLQIMPAMESRWVARERKSLSMPGEKPSLEELDRLLSDNCLN